MRYIMERIEQIITALSSKNSVAIEKEELPAVLAGYAEEKEKIRLRMMEEVFNAEEEKLLLLVIDKYQSVFTRLMDQLYLFQKTIKKTDSRYEAARCLFDHLEELLSFLQLHYRKYFNLQQKMPDLKIDQTVKELQPRIASIGAHLKKSAVPEKLVHLILRPLDNFIELKTTSYAETQYLCRVTDELPGITSDVGEVEVLVRKTLISLEYNSSDICTYYTNELDRLVSAEDSVQNKLRLLKLQLKAINQVALTHSHILHPGLPGLKEQLVNWLNEEIYFYGMEQTTSALQPQGAAGEVKIHTSLSVPQLALLFRLLKEEQLITNSNQSELLKIVAANFTTLQKEQFSYGHLHGKYYKIEASTKRSLYDILMRLLHLSRKIG
jgi:hypothetical protein